MDTQTFNSDDLFYSKVKEQQKIVDYIESLISAYFSKDDKNKRECLGNHLHDIALRINPQSLNDELTRCIAAFMRGIRSHQPNRKRKAPEKMDEYDGLFVIISAKEYIPPGALVSILKLQSLLQRK